jgi:hypothetical protein
LLLSRYRRVVLVSPVAITGGPEAINQLSQSLGAIGVECRILLMGAGQENRLDGRRLASMNPPNHHYAQAYAEYGPRFLREIDLNEDTLVVLSEGLLRQHHRFTMCGLAIWWLSIDNAFRAFPTPEQGEAVMNALFARREVIHLHQSAYARDWLRGRGLERIYDLADYTSPVFTTVPPRGPSPKPIVCYNAVKGSELAQACFEQAPRFEALALQGYTKAELATIFRERMLYVDFGHFPGKDRLPREAAAAGAIVFVHRKGAGACYEDFPLPDAFKFTEEDVSSGELLKRLDAAVADPAGHWARQDHFRSLVAWEKAHFHDQVMRLWGVRRMV